MNSTPIYLDPIAFEVERVQTGLKKKELAQHAGKHPGSLTNLLTKARRGEPISLANLCVLAFALGCDPRLIQLDAEHLNKSALTAMQISFEE